MDNDILGQHALTRITGASFNRLNDKIELEDVLDSAIVRYKLTAIGDPIVHQFEPHGLTAIVLLSESHISIHTWPELGRASLDVFTCGNNPSDKIANYIASTFAGYCKYTTELIYR